MAALPHTLRRYDERAGEILLSEALDHPNRVFQLVHVMGLLTLGELLDGLLRRSGSPARAGRGGAGWSSPTTSPPRS